MFYQILRIYLYMNMSWLYFHNILVTRFLFFKFVLLWLIYKVQITLQIFTKFGGMFISR